MKISLICLLTSRQQFNNYADAIEFNENIDANSIEPFNSEFEFSFDNSVIDLVVFLWETFGDNFEYDDISGALGVIADARFDYAYRAIRCNEHR